MRIRFSLLVLLLISLLYIIVSIAATSRKDISIEYSRLVTIILIYSLVLDILSLFYINSSKGIGIHGGLLCITSISQFFFLFIYIVSIFILQLTSFYPRKLWIQKFSSFNNLFWNKLIFYNTKIINKMGEHLKIVEYPLIILFAINAATLLISTNDLISIFLSIELQSYALYLLSTIFRNSEFSTIGGLTYFLLGGLSSCFILLGTSLLYANSGTTNFDSLYIINNIDNISNNSWYKSYYINVSLLIFSIGFLFKVSAAPFHFWSPDVYDAIPTLVTTFVAIVAKISIFVFLLQLIHYTNNSLFNEDYNFNWTLSLLISSLLSLIIGTIGGLTQFRIKRLFAYSTISHIGFILLALSVYSIESIQAFIFYLVQYSITNLNAFIILITIGYSLYYYTNNNKEYNQLLDINNSPIQLISQLKGYFYINPFLSISLGITIFSFAGIPPLLGFFGKQMVLSAALDKGYIFLSLIGILTSVIGGVYYLNIIKEIFFNPSDYKINSIIKNKSFKGYLYNNNNTIIESFLFSYKDLKMSNYISIIISIITLIILLFLFMNKEWLSMGTILVQFLFNN